VCVSCTVPGAVPLEVRIRYRPGTSSPSGMCLVLVGALVVGFGLWHNNQRCVASCLARPGVRLRVVVKVERAESRPGPGAPPRTTRAQPAHRGDVESAHKQRGEQVCLCTVVSAHGPGMLPRTRSCRKTVTKGSFRSPSGARAESRFSRTARRRAPGPRRVHPPRQTTVKRRVHCA
jgi:hypothetical protein